MKRTAVAVLALVGLGLLLSLGCGRARQEPFALQLCPVPGESYTLRITTEQRNVDATKKEQSTTSQTLSVAYICHVKEVDAEGVATVEVSIDSLSFKREGPSGKIDYDSDNPPAKPHMLVMGLAAMVGRRFSMRITREGRVTELQGIHAMRGEIEKAFGLPEGPMNDALVADLKKQFSNSAMKKRIETITAIYPDRPIALGESWSQKIAIEAGPFPMTMDNTYTLIGLDDDVATIRVRSTVEPNLDNDVATTKLHSTADPNPDGELMEMGVTAISTQLSGTQKGTFELDRATGLVCRGCLKQKLSGTTTIEFTVGTSSSKESHPISIESTIRFKAN